MNELQIFKYENNDVRTVEINGEPWFVLKDVCGVLGVNNSRMVADRLDDDEKGVSQIDTLGGKQSMIVINEPGLYNIILRSDKPEAKPFRKWVTAEVLPTIRRHGAYMTPETLQAAILNPDTMIQLCQQLKNRTKTPPFPPPTASSWWINRSCCLKRNISMNWWIGTC